MHRADGSLMPGTIDDGWTKVHPYNMDRTDGSFVEVKKELQVRELRVRELKWSYKLFCYKFTL